MNFSTSFVRLSRISLYSTALFVASCALGPDYERPEIDAPSEFRAVDGGSSSAESLADLPWWKVFKNSGMQDLIEEALDNNKDLKGAIARCEQARHTVTITQSNLFPGLDYQAGVGRGKNNSLGSPAPTNGMTSSSGTYGMGLSWEIDVWGKVRRETEASVANYIATEEARRAIMLSLVGQVALNYLKLLELDEELVITNKTVVSFEESLDLFRKQQEGGIGDILQVSSAEAALSAAAAQVPLIETNIAQIENALAILLGRAPGKIARGGSLTDLQSTVRVPAGMPVQLLARRPDLRQAEQAMRGANANVGVAITNYFPSFSLTSNLGQISSDLSNMSSSKTASWGLGTNLTGPLFHAGSLVAAEQQAKAKFEETKANYEKTMLQALNEVSDSLIARQKLVDVIEQRRRSVSAYQTAIVASRDRYSAGLSSYYEILQAQQNLFPVEIALAQSRYSYAETFVKLYMALGGGWFLDNEQFSRKTQ